MTSTVYKCKAHQYSHPYTVCTCGCQYCARVWESCPRCSERLQAAPRFSKWTSVRTPPAPSEEKERQG